MYLPERKISGNRPVARPPARPRNCGSGRRPRRQARRNWPPQHSATAIAGQWVGSGVPKAAPMPVMSATSTALTRMQWASSPRK